MDSPLRFGALQLRREVIDADVGCAQDLTLLLNLFPPLHVVLGHPPWKITAELDPLY